MPRFEAKLVLKKKLVNQVYLIVYKTEAECDYKKGQFFSLEVAPKTFRSYSVAHLDKIAPDYVKRHADFEDLETGNYITFMISTKPSGPASQYFEKVEENGEGLRMVGPSGKFKLQENEMPKVFVATGTGLSPFVPMINESLEKYPNTPVYLFFGAFERNLDFKDEFFENLKNNPNFKSISCIDNEEFEETENQRMGRVTTLVPEIVPNLEKSEFYLCGHPMMVKAMEEMLQNEKSVPKEQIIKEAFGVVKKK